MNEREYLILEMHRERINNAENFEQYKEIQLALLDWMLASHKGQNDALEQADNNFIGG